jgi:transposase
MRGALRPAESPAQREWLSTGIHLGPFELRRFPFAHQQLVFQEHKRTIRQIEARVATLDTAIIEAVGQWRFGPVVDALRCLRGVDTVIAATLVAEIGDISRFDSPRQLMAWLGLVPSEHSSGATVRRGRITKTGNALARSMLIEASWSYRRPAREG